MDDGPSLHPAGDSDFFRALFEAHPQPMWVYDPDTMQVLAINDAALGHLGARRADLVGTKIEAVPALPAGDAGGCRHRLAGGREAGVDIAPGLLAVDGRRAALATMRSPPAPETSGRGMEPSHERFRQLADAMPLIVWTAGPDGTLDYVSQAFYAYVGVERMDLPAREWVKAIHPDDVGRSLTAWTARIGDGAPGAIEMRLHRGHDGAFRWHLITVKPVRDAAGTIVKWFGSAADIHEQKLAAEKLRESEERLHAIFEYESQGMAVVSLDGTLLDLNPTGLRMAEAEDAADAIGRSLASLVLPEDVPVYRRTHDIAAGGNAARIRLRLRGLHGGERWVEMHAVPMRRGDGAIASVLVVIEDVGDRRQAERALAAARRQTEQILEAIADGVLVLDTEGRVLRQNPAAAAMLGWTDGDIVGRNVLRLVRRPAADREPGAPEIHPILDTLRDGRTRRVEQEIFSGRDGVDFPVEYDCASLRDDSGGPAGAVVSFRDVTERLRLEAMRASETDVLRMISGGASLPAVLERIALAIEALATGAMASIVLLDADGIHIRHGAAPHLPETYIQAIDGLAVGPATGSCGTAMHRGEAVMVADIMADPLWAEYREIAAAHGLRACWSTPVKNAAGAVLASFALYHREPRQPTAEEVALSSRFANIVAIAIERIRIVDSLRESEERFRQLAENIQEVFWMIDPVANRLLYVSPAFEAIWGRDRQDLYDGTVRWSSTIHAADRDRIVEIFRGNRAGRHAEEYRVVRPDGDIRWISDRAFPVHDRDGNIYRVVGTARDITERKKTEGALRESEQRFQAVSAAIVDVIWDWDLVNDTLWWSEDFERVFGHPRESVASGQTWIARIHPDDRDRVAADVHDAIARRDRFWACEYRFLRRDGTVLDIEDRGCLVVDPDGTPLRFVGGMSDITERKRAQRALRERMKELRCLYRVLELTSDPARPVGEICHDVVCILPQSLLHEEIAVARITLEGVEHLCVPWRPPVASMRVAITGRDTRQAGYVEVGYAEALPGTAAAAPGSFLKEEREMVEAVAAHLGRMLDGRQMAAKLTQSERLRAVGELTGGVAHDFNNLLTVILGNAEILADDLSSQPHLRSLARMTQEAAERAADLTRHLLAFSRRQALAPAVTDIERLVAGMSALLRRALGEHVEVETVCRAGLWQALVDPAQLESAVLNLCINARDAMPEGGRLTIELANVRLDAGGAGWEEEPAAGEYVLVAVSDTGTGMPPDVLARVFEPFFTTKDTGKGSGLGLSMVYGFAKQSRGHVKISSEPGQGTTVRLFLPRAAASADSGDVAGPQSALPRGVENILVVEDDDMVRGHVSAQLEALGYRVASVKDGASALDVLRQGATVDLLFTDVVMPGGMNGRQLADAARGLRPQLPVLFTSGYAEDAIMHDGRLDPGVHLLGKPYRRADLAAKVREVLGARG